ncbi:MAG: right-handed parallel beta-helix repeat-containing protein [Thermoplasmata archaeon]|nr:right-handed parallel beta-helix repeat-containing protein [Thermoplasmata archaeon]
MAVWLCFMMVASSAFVMVGVEDAVVEGKVVVKDGVTYTTHAPIRIDSNADFGIGINGVSAGDGSVGDPWIIEGWDIDGSGFGYCIFIGNTTDYFVVRDCYLHHASGNNWLYYWNTGLYLINVNNGTLTNNIASINKHGIFLRDSSNNNILTNNTATSNTWIGIGLYSSDNILFNNTATNNLWGIGLGHSGNIVTNNTISNNKEYGIRPESSINITLSNNTLINNGIYIFGSDLEHWNSHSIDISNTVNGKPMYYWKNQNTGTVPLGAGQVILANCTGVTIEGQNVSMASAGIMLAFSHINTITNNTATLNYDSGIRLYQSSDNVISSNNASNNDYYGICLTYQSNGNVISNNNASNNDYYGIWLISDSSIISNNTLINNGNGIYANSNNIISNNTASNNSQYGINLGGGNNIFSNNTILNNEVGIYLRDVNNIISNNTILNNSLHGIHVYFSSKNTFSNNTLINNGIYIYGDNLEHWNSHNIDLSNTVNSKPIYYWKNQNNDTVPLGAGQVILANCTSVTIEGQNVSMVFSGVMLAFSHNNTITNNTATLNYWGICLLYSNGNTLSYNTVSFNGRGIYPHSSMNNSIYHNNIIDDTYQPYDNGDNLWDNGYPSGGNYWSDYSGLDLFSDPEQKISGSDGIGDTPYVFDVNSIDNYPLVNPWPYADIYPPVIALNNPNNNSYINPGINLGWDVFDISQTFTNYSINGGINVSFSPPYDLNTTGWSDGLYEIEIHANDTTGNNVSRSYNFIIDTTDPVIILNYPANNSLIKAGTIIDLVVTDDNIDMVNYSVNGGANQTLNPSYDINTTGWTDGLYSIEAHAIDDALNTAIEIYEFTIDSTAPTITLISPANNSVILPGTMLDFDVSDLHLIEVSYSINGGANTSFTAPYDADTTGWIDGVYTIEVHAIDDAGNTAIEIYEFIIDITPPIVDAGSDAFVNTPYTQDATTIDATSGIATYQWTQQSGPGTITFGTPNSEDTTIQADIDGDFIIRFNVTDNANNWAWDEFQLIWDTTSPSIVLNTPINNSFITNGTILDFDIIEFDLNNTNYSINGAPTQAFLPPYDIDTTGWADGTYDIMIKTIDNASNVNSKSFTFHVDSNSPVTTLLVYEPVYLRDVSPVYCVLPSTNINLACTDGNGSGINNTWFRFGRLYMNEFSVVIFTWTNWTMYEGTFPISDYLQGNGANSFSFEFFSTDILGNNESIHNTSFLFDLGNPWTSITYKGTYVKSSDMFTLYATDVGSGVFKTYYRFGNSELYIDYWSEWMEYNGTFYLENDGDWEIEYYSADFLGNEEDIKGISVVVDNIIPYIVNVFPDNNSVDIPVDSTVSIRFSEPIKLTLLHPMVEIEPNIPYRFSRENDYLVLRLTFEQNLSIGTYYQVTILEQNSDTAGNEIGHPFTFGFTTEGDSDNDGIPDSPDPDDDNDGVPDIEDAFPFDPTETLDTDNDGIGNEADDDDDGDGVIDTEDAYPLDPEEYLDTDLDGIGDNADTDDDDDGVPDEQDADPLDPDITDIIDDVSDDVLPNDSPTNYWWLLLLMAAIVILSLLFIMRKKPEAIVDPEPELETELCPTCGFDIEPGQPCPFCEDEPEPVVEPEPHPNQEILDKLEKAFKDGKISEENYQMNIEKFKQ